MTGGNRVSAKLNLGGQQEYGRLAVKAEKKKRDFAVISEIVDFR